MVFFFGVCVESFLWWSSAVRGLSTNLLCAGLCFLSGLGIAMAVKPCPPKSCGLVRAVSRLDSSSLPGVDGSLTFLPATEAL